MTTNNNNWLTDTNTSINNSSNDDGWRPTSSSIWGLPYNEDVIRCLNSLRYHTNSLNEEIDTIKELIEHSRSVNDRCSNDYVAEIQRLKLENYELIKKNEMLQNQINDLITVKKEN